MASFTSERTIAAAPEQVFALFADLERWPELLPDVVAVELLGPKPVGKGTRFRETRRFLGKEASEEMEFTAFDPPRSYVVEATSHGAHFRTAFTFVPSGQETRVQVELTCEPQSFMAKMTLPLMAGALHKCIERDLDALAGADGSAG